MHLLPVLTTEKKIIEEEKNDGKGKSEGIVKSTKNLNSDSITRTY